MENISQSTCSVIPPHMHWRVAEHGDAAQRRRAAATLSHMALLNAARAAVIRAGSAAAAVMPRAKQRFIYDAGGRRTQSVDQAQLFEGNSVLRGQTPIQR